MQSFEGEVALVTGGATGIGKAAALPGQRTQPLSQLGPLRPPWLVPAGRPRQPDHGARVALAQPELRHGGPHRLPPRCGPQAFFPRSSLRAWLSSVRSATSRMAQVRDGVEGARCVAGSDPRHRGGLRRISLRHPARQRAGAALGPHRAVCAGFRSGGGGWALRGVSEQGCGNSLTPERRTPWHSRNP